MPEREDGLMTAKEAQEYLRVSRSTFIRMEKDGKIVRIKLGPKTIRYSKADLDALIAAGREESTPPDA